MKTNLTDFTIEQIAFMIQLADASWRKSTDSIIRMEDMFTDHVLLKRNGTYLNYVNEQSLAASWLCQLTIAKDIIQSRETVTSN